MYKPQQFPLLKWCFCLFSLALCSQQLPSDKVVAVEDLAVYLKKEIKDELGDDSPEKLAAHFRTVFQERYFYEWTENDTRFEEYKTLYPAMEVSHTTRAQDHLDKFDASTHWKLPFNYKNDTPINAYGLRHLARQHKMVDISFLYRYKDKDAQYIDYFTGQLQSLNDALIAGEYETIPDGNGVYEAFRSGYRVLNWLQIHNGFLGEKAYSDKEQLTTVATLLQHASHLYENNAEFKSGNHQTRGLSALAMLAIIFSDFQDADLWYERAMSILEQHLQREINEDGFQFERTIHYHQSDIDNYFYIYQLAQKSNKKVSAIWEERLRSLFTTLTKIAFPDGSAPVLSDDTDAPWAEKNDISGTLTLGYLLFDDPEMGYFAKSTVKPKYLWNLSKEQLGALKEIKATAPQVGSYAFENTGYYIMREGWNDQDNMLVIAAGLDGDKPDHQHGDMLGIQAMANGKVVLPNYQVRYSLEDLELFKNSMVKNVALVDNELQGKQYTSNKGGSGFGKFKELPTPKVLGWSANATADVFVGSHNGFENVGVSYTRQVINIENEFWIVKDNFKSKAPHTYKQVWQGHYSSEHSPELLRATFDNGSGLDILQLQAIDTVVTDGKRGKEWSVVQKAATNNFSFVTVLYPFDTYDKRIDEDSMGNKFADWSIIITSDTQNNSITLSKDDTNISFATSQLTIGDVIIDFSQEADVMAQVDNKRLFITLLSDKTTTVTITQGKQNISQPLAPAALLEYKIK
jgi:hypothetical protein